MNFALLLPAILATLLVGCATTPPGATKPAKPGQHMTVRTTAYTHTEPGGRRNGVDGVLHFGGDVYSSAADWSWMPLGTRFLMNGHKYVIEDYGSALVGRKTIDLYMPSRAMMRNWGVRNVDIQILEWGSNVMSLKLLEGRQGSAHVRQMVAVLRKQRPSPSS
jgi:3D (Asp-Asp-Asp) domain-containing protein